MSYTYHGTTDLIALPGRSMQTFPSGMIRVDRSYLCRKGLEANFREQFAVGKDLPLDDSTPAIDGLKIYPEVQEIYRDDGFVEFRASAYGRKNLTGKVEYRYRTGVAPVSALVRTFEFNGQTYTLQANTRNSLIPDQLILRNAIVHRCIPIDEAPETGRTLQGDAFFEDTNESIESRAYSRTQLASELFSNLFEARTYVYRPPFVSDEARLTKRISVGNIEVKTFGSFQEIREIHLISVIGFSVGSFNDIGVRLPTEGVAWERISEDRYAAIIATFERPLNSETLGIRINISGRPEQVVFEKQGIGYGGSTISTGYSGLQIITSATNNGRNIRITFESRLPSSMSDLQIQLFAEGQNEQSVSLSQTTWPI